LSPCAPPQGRERYSDNIRTRIRVQFHRGPAQVAATVQLVTSTADRPAASVDPADAEALASLGAVRRVTRRGRDTQSRLLAAAYELFNTTPFHETRIVDITKRAGISAGSFYTYFDSKDALFRVIAQHVLDAMYAAPQRDPDNSDKDPIRDIAHASRRYFQVCLEHRVIAQSIEQLRNTDRQVATNRRDTLRRGVKRTARWIRQLQERGVCSPHIDPWYTALALQAMNVSVAYDQLVHRDEADDIDALVAAVTPIWARAVGLDT
jgi:AcrR family transcriptional regulator